MSGYLDDRPDQGMGIMHALQASAHAQGAQRLGQGGDYQLDERQAHDAADSHDDRSTDYSEVDSEEEDRRVAEEWRETVAQTYAIFNLVVIPYIGKIVGRKWAYWGELSSVSLFSCTQLVDYRLPPCCPQLSRDGRSMASVPRSSA